MAARSDGSNQMCVTIAIRFSHFGNQIAETPSFGSVRGHPTVAAIREGLAHVKAGRTKPARAALKALAKKYGIATPDK
jgi:predicted transcriptional regulator